LAIDRPATDTIVYILRGIGSSQYIALFKGRGDEKGKGKRQKAEGERMGDGGWGMKTKGRRQKKRDGGRGD
jgi:hypothetical protein